VQTELVVVAKRPPPSEPTDKNRGAVGQRTTR